MLLDATLAYLHFLCIIALVSLILAEAALLRPALIAQSGRWLAKLDIGVAIAAVAVLASGLSRAVWGAKGWGYYAHNPVFHTKIGVFVLIALLSIVPTLQFIRWAKAFRRDPAYMVPAAELKRAKRYVMIELHLLVLLPLFGVMMARGLHF
jgi:putative membrane protein